VKVKKVVVVGCGIAGMAAAEAARAIDKDVEIVVIDSSLNAPYSRFKIEGEKLLCVIIHQTFIGKNSSFYRQAEEKGDSG